MHYRGSIGYARTCFVTESEQACRSEAGGDTALTIGRVNRTQAKSTKLHPFHRHQ